MLSFWERESFTRYDYIIIGSGITGLSVAAELVENQPKARIVVLERGIFPTGASTKNAGFACIGSPTELLSDLKLMSTEEVSTLVAMRFNGLKLLRRRLGDHVIKYKERGSYELLSEKELPCLEQIPYLNKLLYPIVKADAFVQNNGIIDQYGFNKQYFKAAITNHCEGQLDTGAMMQGLLSYVQKRGVQVINGAEVVRWHDNRQKVAVQVKHPTLATDIVFTAKKIAVCTNAFAKQLLPNIDITPGRGQVIVTKPILQLPFKGTYHFDEGFYYFRNYGNRVIFGGGRNIDFQTENTTQFAYNEKIMNELTTKLQKHILPQTPFEIDMRWVGIMAFGKTKYPYLFAHSPNVIVGAKLSGMGVAIGSELGRRIAHLMDIKPVMERKVTLTS
jgi:gamma-glutamylputrescine oxidase